MRRAAGFAFAWLMLAGLGARAATELPVPAILLFHGGGWVAGEPDWVFASARRFADQGMVAVSVQYRLASRQVTPIDALSDVCHAFRWVRSKAGALLPPSTWVPMATFTACFATARRRPRTRR